MRNMWRMAHMGLEFAGAMVVLALIGWLVDRRYGTAPIFALIGGGVGFTGGMYLFIKAALKANRANAPTTHRTTDHPTATTRDPNHP